MKNYLLYLDCYTQDSINECRFSLLKFLAVYNLIPPANIHVIVYTSKAAGFEIFLSYFKNMQVIETGAPAGTDIKTRRKKILDNYDGNVVISTACCYITRPIEQLFNYINSEKLIVFKQQNKAGTASSAQLSFWEAPVVGIKNGIHNFTSKPGDAPLQEATKTGKEGAQLIEVNNYFTCFQKVKDLPKLLRILFQKNEEESIPNLVKIVHHIDADSIGKEADAINKLPFLKKWVGFITGKNSLVRRYRNKL